MSEQGTNLGVRLRFSRQTAGLTSEGLARRSKSSKSRVLDIETGKTKRPSCELLFKFATALDVSAEWLWTGKTSATEADDMGHLVELASAAMKALMCEGAIQNSHDIPVAAAQFAKKTLDELRK